MKNLCDRLAGLIVRQSTKEDADIEVISYGLQGVLGTAAEFALIILSGIILGMLKEILVMSAAFVLVRLMAGGVHFSTYNRCLVSSVLIFVSGGLLVRLIDLLPFAGIFYLAFGSMFTAYCIYRHSPGTTPGLSGRRSYPNSPGIHNNSYSYTGGGLGGLHDKALPMAPLQPGDRLFWRIYSYRCGYLLVKYIENKLNEGGGVRNEKS